MKLAAAGRAVLRGVGQIYLQRSAVSGALFLAALAVESIGLAVFAFVGSLTGVVTALLLRVNQDDIDDGLYGFNAALVALMGAAFLHLDVTGLLVTGLAVIVSTLQFHLARRRGWQVFTAPFVLTALTLTLLPMGLITATPARLEVEVIARHFGQVMFLDNTWSGLLCVAGVFAGARVSGVAALVASALVFALTLLVPGAPHAQQAGLYGFNAVLTAIALHQQQPRWLHTTLGALLATALTALAIHFDVRVFTAPFVVLAWLGTRRGPFTPPRHRSDQSLQE